LPDPDQDPLAAVREHLDEAHAAADRLVREAQRAADARAGVPPRGWEADPEAERAAPADLRALVALLDGARRAVPPELARQLAEALRELLVAVRAVLDFYIELLGEPRDAPGGPEVEDIALD
jgi:hypothetical protein